MAVRDSQRQKLYDAENVAFRNLREPMSLEEAQTLVDAICASAALAEKWPRAANSPAVIKAHGRRRGACYSPTTRSIELSKDWSMKWVVLHELAHHFVRKSTPKNIAPHGREYAECYLLLVRVYMGRGWSDALEAQFKAKRVAYKPKRAYTISDDERERRRTRAKELAAKRWS